MKTSHPLTRQARALALCAVLALATVSAARAQDWTREDDPDFVPRGAISHGTVDGNIVDVQIQVDGGTAPLYFRPGITDRHYFQAFRGRNYSVVVRNTTGRRVGVLIAVDGLNVVTGEKSALRRTESMYVLDPYESAVIRGWRTSLDEVRRFVFVDEERSYASRTDQANGDMGWIRVLAFRENERTPWLGIGKVRGGSEARDERARRDIDNAPNAAAPPVAEPRTQELGQSDRAGAALPEGALKSEARRSEAFDANPGTGWGERRQDPVRTTVFEAAAQPSDRIALRYEYATGLRALGIFPRQPRVWDRERGQMGFAKPPRR